MTVHEMKVMLARIPDETIVTVEMLNTKYANLHKAELRECSMTEIGVIQIGEEI